MPAQRGKQKGRAAQQPTSGSSADVEIADPELDGATDDEEDECIELPPGHDEIDGFVQPVSRAGGSSSSRRDLPQRTTSGPLADDFTFEEADVLHKTVRGRREEARKKRKKYVTSTQANYDSVERCWFNSFIDYAQWDGVKKRVWVDEKGEITAEADGVFRRFFEWLREAQVSRHTFKVRRARTPACVELTACMLQCLLVLEHTRTMHVTERFSPRPPAQMCLAWAQRELNNQLCAKMKQPREAYVCNIPCVKVLKDELYADARTTMLEAMSDLHAKVEADISPKEMLTISRHLLDLNIPAVRAPQFAIASRWSSNTRSTSLQRMATACGIPTVSAV